MLSDLKQNLICLCVHKAACRLLLYPHEIQERRAWGLYCLVLDSFSYSLNKRFSEEIPCIVHICSSLSSLSNSESLLMACLQIFAKKINKFNLNIPVSEFKNLFESFRNA